MSPELARLIKALEALFGAEDRMNHPVVYRSAMPDGSISAPKADEMMHRCQRCADKLFEADEAFRAYRVVKEKS
jgi:hypothetical protein